MGDLFLDIIRSNQDKLEMIGAIFGGLSVIIALIVRESRK